MCAFFRKKYISYAENCCKGTGSGWYQPPWTRGAPSPRTPPSGSTPSWPTGWRSAARSPPTTPLLTTRNQTIAALFLCSLCSLLDFKLMWLPAVMLIGFCKYKFVSKKKCCFDSGLLVLILHSIDVICTRTLVHMTEDAKYEYMVYKVFSCLIYPTVGSWMIISFLNWFVAALYHDV